MSNFTEMSENPFTFLREMQKSGGISFSARRSGISNPLQTGQFLQFTKVGTEFACIKWQAHTAVLRRYSSPQAHLVQYTSKTRRKEYYGFF